MLRTTFLTALLAVAAAAQPSPPILLWPDGAPGAKGTEDADKPSITPYLPPPEKANGTAVLVCPGGGYQHLAMDHEGKQVAEWLNQHGVAAFVLKYRLGPRYMHPAPLQDATQAIRIIRRRAQEFHVAADRVGIWGFSAGGHLVTTLATHWDRGSAGVPSSRPDFLIAIYPVVSLTEPWTHQGSKTNLIGKDPDPALAENLSNDKQVNAETPPTFLLHTWEDKAVPAENSVMFYLALRRAKVPAEMHLYEKGPHGFGLGGKAPILSTWPDRLAQWMDLHGWLKPAAH